MKLAKKKEKMHINKNIFILTNFRVHQIKLFKTQYKT